MVSLNAPGELVAYGDLEDYGHIDHLYVRPDVAGGGVASKLLAGLLERAVSAGMSKVYVEASELARGLFARKGFDLAPPRF